MCTTCGSPQRSQRILALKPQQQYSTCVTPLPIIAQRVDMAGCSQRQHSGTHRVTGLGQRSQGLQSIRQTSTFGGGGQQSSQPRRQNKPASAGRQAALTATNTAASTKRFRLRIWKSPLTVNSVRESASSLPTIFNVARKTCFFLFFTT